MAGRIVDPSVEETTERSAPAPDVRRRRAARKAALLSLYPAFY